MNKHLFHKLLYSLELKYFTSHHILLRHDDECESIYMVFTGVLEVYTEFEGNEFIIERLKSGSILNYRVIFTDDRM